MASFRDVISAGVDVVLSGGDGSLPGIVGGRVGVADVSRLTSPYGKRDGLGLGTWVVSSADRDGAAETVLDGNTTNTGHADLLMGGTGKLELPIRVTVQTSNGLSSGSLSRWPLRLLVTSRASIRAEGVLDTSSRSCGHDVGDLSGIGSVVRSFLDSDPSIETKVGVGNGTVCRWEGTAVQLTTWEVGVKTRTGRAAG